MKDQLELYPMPKFTAFVVVLLATATVLFTCTDVIEAHEAPEEKERACTVDTRSFNKIVRLSEPLPSEKNASITVQIYGPDKKPVGDPVTHTSKNGGTSSFIVTEPKLSTGTKYTCEIEEDLLTLLQETIAELAALIERFNAYIETLLESE